MSSLGRLVPLLSDLESICSIVELAGGPVTTSLLNLASTSGPEELVSDMPMNRIALRYGLYSPDVSIWRIA